MSTTITTPKPSTKKKRSRDASSDEERWLDALESGKLEEMDDELRKIKPKDPKLMTARQRAMYDKDTKDTKELTLLALPSGYKEKVMTAEAIQKAALKSIKRKQQADEKREKDKKKTMERILKKQETKIQKSASIRNSNKNITPSITYRQSLYNSLLSFHIDLPCPIERKVASEPPPPIACGMKCGRLKRYSCAKTGMPLCSLECYKRNMLLCKIP